jgi:hypothetical protein
MRCTLPAAALLALMVPMIGRADDADTEKTIGRLSRQANDASVKGDATALEPLIADDFMLINQSERSIPRTSI